LRWLPYFPARPGANPTVSDRRSIVRLGRWQTSGSHRMFRTSCRPGVNFPTCVGVLPPARPMITSDSHLVLILQLGSCPTIRLSPAVVATFSLRRLLLRLAACAACRPSATPAANFRLASAVLLHRLHRFRFARLAPCASTSGWAFDAPLASIEPCIAGGAVDEYSMYAGSCTFRICQLLQLPTCVGFCSLWRDQRSLCGFRLRFHPLAGLAVILRLSSAFRSTNRSGTQLPIGPTMNLQLQSELFVFQ